MVENHQRFEPRQWVMAHMTCQQSTAILERSIRQHTPGPWSTALAVKVNGLHGMHYWNEEDMQRFAGDYRFLKSTIKRLRSERPG
jgi:hypothetical protein